MMNLEATARQITNATPTLDEHSLSEFLARHPEFLPTHCTANLTAVLQTLLQQRPDLFADLTLPRPPDGVASLPHTQLRLFREKLSRLDFAITTLRATADANAQLDRVLHEFACALMRTSERNPDQVIRLINHYFDVDCIRLFPIDTLALQSQALFEGWLASRTPLCGRLTEAQRLAIFAADLPDTGSAALIAIGENPSRPRWILALGRRTPDGFNASQGTLFLMQIGDLVHAFLDVQTATTA